MEYLKIPMNFCNFFEAGQNAFERCTEKESIYKHIEILLMTTPGEHRFDSGYGCRIRELDFAHIESNEKWEIILHHHIMEAVTKYEKRLTDINIVLNVYDRTREDALFGAATARKYVEINIIGSIVSTGEKCRFEYMLYLGPLSKE